MHNQGILKNSMIKNLKNKEFVKIKRVMKSYKIYNFFKYVSFLILLSSLIPLFSNVRMIIAVIGIIGVLFFEDKIKNAEDYINQINDIVNIKYKDYLNSMEMAEFRIKNLNDLKLNNISKEDYIKLINEELELIYNLIKKESFNESKVSLSLYKNDVEHIFEMVNIASKGNFLTLEDVRKIKKKWNLNIHSLSNLYSKTELEDDLKYLQRIIEKKEVK